jgi:hypothetical protein
MTTSPLLSMLACNEVALHRLVAITTLRIFIFNGTRQSLATFRFPSRQCFETCMPSITKAFSSD